ncbi:MAG: DUF190 domain-containing protein [bacterium]|nr:DUF190 domain-containing protein [bacterium]
MNDNLKRKQVSVYINEGDEWRSKPLHLQILKVLHHENLSGATVLRAVAGFSRGEEIHTISFIDASGKLPLVIRFVDTEENIMKVLPQVREMAPGRLITIYDVEIVPEVSE